MNENSNFQMDGHIARSVSLENLRPRSNPQKVPRFMDDTVTVRRLPNDDNSDNIQEGSDPLLRDLDTILRNKLKLGTESPVISRNNSLNSLRSLSRNGNQAFIKDLGLDGDVTTLSQDESDNRLNQDIPNGTDAIDDDEDDDEFVNVDEIDGPIGGHLADIRGGRDIENEDSKDYNLPANNEYQRSLDRRVAELESGISSKARSQLKIDWEFQEFYDLERELPDWFSISDYAYLPQTRTNFSKKVRDPVKFVKDINYAESTITALCNDLSNDLSSNLMALTYISMGNFTYAESMDVQIQMIQRNNILFTMSLPEIIKAFKLISKSCQEDKSNLKHQTVLLFYASTILFFIINVSIDQRELHPTQVKTIIQTFEDTKMLQFLTGYIESWRWNSRLSMRIRNIITLLHKMIMLQFGDLKIYKKYKTGIYNYHGLGRSEKSTKNLTISPLHFQAFKEDIVSRFPNYEIKVPEFPEIADNSNSLSQFLEIPRSKSKSSINATLPVPDRHLATPAPSPPGSPVLTPFTDGLRSRTSFQTNMAYPYLYPSDNECDDELTSRVAIKFNQKDLEHDIFVPQSVEEAAKILQDNLEIKLSVKQLWNERDLFMATERGWDATNSSNEYTYSIIENKEDLEEINTMKRIDNYYKDCLPSMNSLVFVLLQIMESNLSNMDYKENDLPNGITVESLTPQLEIIKAKEASLKSSVGIFFLLLKWLKLNHILKYEQLSVLLYDSGYISTSTAILGKYANIYTDKVFNKTLTSTHSYWKTCSTFNPIYNKAYSIQKLEKDKINVGILTMFAYLLRNLRKIIGSKTHRLKNLPLSVGPLFKQYYNAYNLDIYHPILRIIRELTPFKNKRWKSEHMNLISGVYLYERLELIDNWVTGKDVSGELMDAYGQEIALRALIQFYNFEHYELSMEELGYSKRVRSNSDLLYKDSEIQKVE